jgi:hypothetical protein
VRVGIIGGTSGGAIPVARDPAGVVLVAIGEGEEIAAGIDEDTEGVGMIGGADPAGVRGPARSEFAAGVSTVRGNAGGGVTACFGV